AMIIDWRSDRLSVGRLNGLHRDWPVRAWDREPFELASRQLWFWVEQGADVSGALPTYRAVATDIDARNAALTPPTLHLCNVGIELREFLGAHDRLLLGHLTWATWHVQTKFEVLTSSFVVSSSLTGRRSADLPLYAVAGHLISWRTARSFGLESLTKRFLGHVSQV